MTVIGTVELLAKINTSDYTKGEKNIAQSNKNIEKGTKDATQKADQSFSKFVSNVGKMSLVFSAAIGAAFVSAVKSVANLEQSLGGSEVVFGKYASKIQKYAKTSFANMGTDMNQFLETANKMGSLFQGAGFSVGKSTDITIKAMQRATDVATAMGISTEMALESIAGAAKGNFTMMDNLGVAMNDTAIGAYAVSKGIKKSTQAMTTGEKVALAMQLFMERTAKYAGNYARENDTLAGSFQTLKGAWGNFLSGVEGSDKMLAGAIVNMGKVLAKNIPKIASQLGGLVSGLADNFLDSNNLRGYVEVIKQVASVITILLIPAMTRYIALQTLAGVSAMIAGARMVAGWLMALGPIGLVAAAVGAATALIVMNWSSIRQVALDALNSIARTAIAVFNVLRSVFSRVMATVGLPFVAAYNQIKRTFSGLPAFFKGIWSSLTSIFGGIGRAIGNAIGGAFKGVINGIISFVESTINGIIKSINSVAEGIDKALPGDQSGWRVPSVKLPRLAEGGVVSKATIAMIGEGSEPEAVLPLSKLDAMLNNDGGGNNNGRGIKVDTIIINRDVDVDLVARKLGIEQLQTQRGIA